MSMYSVNSSIPKTLVRYLVEYVKDNSTAKRKKTVSYTYLFQSIIQLVMGHLILIKR